MSIEKIVSISSDNLEAPITQEEKEENKKALLQLLAYVKEDVERGTTRSIAVCGQEHSGRGFSCYHDPLYGAGLIGELEILKIRLMQEHMEIDYTPK